MCVSTLFPFKVAGLLFQDGTLLLLSWCIDADFVAIVRHIGLVMRQTFKRIGNAAGTVAVKFEPCILLGCMIMAQVNSLHVDGLIFPAGCAFASIFTWSDDPINQS